MKHVLLQFIEHRIYVLIVHDFRYNSICESSGVSFETTEGASRFPDLLTSLSV